MALEKYKKMRDFQRTPEPEGKIESRKGQLKFVVQKHDASHLHYDFRLEMGGVLKSWAIPKGPSLDPKDKRLAMMTEDHPMSYRKFEGVIPEGSYGAGEVIVWDIGTYRSLNSGRDEEKGLLSDLEKGSLKFELDGEKLRGAFALVKIKNQSGGKDNAWLLIKEKDDFASKRIVADKVGSVLSDKVLSRDGGENFVSSKRTKIPKKSPRRGHDDLPRGLKPMLATLADAPFDGKDWMFEIKYDGYRAMARIDKGEVELYSRNLLSFNSKYPEIVKALREIKDDVLLDGEIVSVDSKGISNFQYLQHYAEKKRGTLLYYVFDILHLNGEDLFSRPLLERKGILKTIIPEGSLVRFGEHVLSQGKELFSLAERSGLEGIIAKEIESSYISGVRSRSWLKIKTEQRQEAVIAGFTKPRGSRKKFGALILGAYKGDELIYIGHTGTGFNEKKISEVYSRLKDKIIDKPPFRERPKTNMPATWVRPELVAEIRFTEWTEGGSMRHPVFLDLREDKPASEVVVESEVSAREISGPKKNVKSRKSSASDLKLTNLDKIYWPMEGFTKGDLLDYYRAVSPVILPHLLDRPESLNRHPDGIQGPNFFQKNIRTSTPGFVKTVRIRSESEDREINWLLCQNQETLLYMANLGCIEINPWNARYQTPDNPDYLIIDLDPDDPNPFSEVVEVALVARRILEKAEIPSYIKTSGKTGMHIVIPLKALYDQNEARIFGEILANLIHSKLPGNTSVLRTPAKRRGKIYIDFLQNRTGQTIAAPYSARPFKGGTVSAPLRWEEVTKKLSPFQFTIKNMPKRLDKIGDIWCPVQGKGIDLMDALKNLQK